MNVLKVKKTLLMSLMLIFMVVLAACGGNNNNDNQANNTPPANNNNENNTPVVEPPVEQEVDKTPVTIKVATWVPKANEGFQAIPNAFTAKYPWITVEWVELGGGAPMKEGLTKAIAADDPIDVFWNDTFTDIVLEGFAEDLDPFIANDEEFKSYPMNPAILETFQWEGKQYGISRGNDTFLVFYNKELLSKYGMEPPSLDWTWDDFKEMAKKATDPTEKNYGIANSAIIFQFAVPTIPTANGHAAHVHMLNEDMTASVADQSEVLDDLQWALDWVVKDEIMLNAKRMADKGIEGDMWANGQALFNIHVSPLIGAWKPEGALKFAWDVAPYPKGTEKQVGMSFNNPMFMSKASKHKEAAWLFMKFWGASVEGQKLLIDAGGTFPNSSDPEIVDYFKSNQLYQGLNGDALVRAAEIGEVDTRMTALGGNFVGEVMGGFSAEGYENEVSAYDYYPPAIEKLNKDLADLRESSQ